MPITIATLYFRRAFIFGGVAVGVYRTISKGEFVKIQKLKTEWDEVHLYKRKLIIMFEVGETKMGMSGMTVSE